MLVRLDRVETLLRQCKTTNSIQTLLAAEWGVTQRCIRLYIAKVYDKWQEEAKSETVSRRELRRAQLEGVLELAVTGFEPDLKAAVAAIDRLCKIDGVFAPIEHSHTLPDGSKRDLKSMTSGERRNAMAELFAKYAAQLPKVSEGN